MPKRRLLRWAIVVISIYFIVTTLRSMVDLVRARDKLIRRERELAALLSEHEDLLRQQNVVEDQSYLEKVARDKLGLVRQGEETIVVAPELLVGPAEASPDATLNYLKWWRLLL